MSQPVTAALRQWIVEQAGRGLAVPDLIQSMCSVGWQESVARRAVEQVLREHFNILVEPQDWPAAGPVPEPALGNSPLYLDLGDRQVEVLLQIKSPRVVLFGNLLSPKECEDIIAAARPRMKRSLTVATRTGGEELNDDRTSDGMFFRRGENDTIARLEQRIARLVRWPIENGEGVQVLNYRPGAEYKPHYDFFDPAEPGTPALLARGGQRVGTLVIYLNNPIQGGGTIFPDIHLEVGPRQGNAVFFSYARADSSTRTLHGGAPVIEGEKWIATKWLREREFV